MFLQTFICDTELSQLAGSLLCYVRVCLLLLPASLGKILLPLRKSLYCYQIFDSWCGGLCMLRLPESVTYFPVIVHLEFSNSFKFSGLVYYFASIKALSFIVVLLAGHFCSVLAGQNALCSARLPLVCLISACMILCTTIQYA